MKIGQLVMLIGTDGFMPPLGSVGEIIGPLDEDGDYEVLFPNCRCPVPPGEWFVQTRFLMPINEDPPKVAEFTCDVLTA